MPDVLKTVGRYEILREVGRGGMALAGSCSGLIQAAGALPDDRTAVALGPEQPIIGIEEP